MDSLQVWQTYLPGFQFSSGDALEFACGSFYIKKNIKHGQLMRTFVFIQYSACTTIPFAMLLLQSREVYK